MNATGYHSEHYMGFFLHDDWRISPRLTVNLGMRWDDQSPVTERDDRLTSQFDLSQLNPVSPAAQAAYSAILADPKNATNTGVQLLSQVLPGSAFKVPGVIVFPGVNGNPRGYSNPDYHEVQPRAGFAYQIGH